VKVALPEGAPKGMRVVERLRSGDLALGTQGHGLVLLRGGRLVQAGPALWWD
jgi:hypothetical protein